MTVGGIKEITLQVEVQNNEEEAHEAQLFVLLPPSIKHHGTDERVRLCMRLYGRLLVCMRFYRLVRFFLGFLGVCMGLCIFMRVYVFLFEFLYMYLYVFRCVHVRSIVPPSLPSPPLPPPPLPTTTTTGQTVLMQLR